MHALTADDVRAALVNATPDERRQFSVPTAFMLIEWDHTDFAAWRDPNIRGRGYLVVERAGAPTAIVLRSAETTSRARSGLCNMCHTMQPGDAVSLFSARRAGAAGERGDSVGSYMCADLSCHENVRLAMPLAPNEVRSSVDDRIDGTRRRVEDFVERVVAP